MIAPILHRTFALLAVAILVAASSVPVAPPARAQNAPAAPAIDQNFMNRAADIAYNREVDRARAAKTLDTDRIQYANARRMSLPLMAYAASVAPVATTWIWVVNIVTREEPIAYCLPGGKIMLSTGLVDRARLTPPEISAVMAHAIAHALAGHDAAAAAARFAALREAADPNRRLLQLAEILLNVVQNDVHDMASERATDAVALELMARAGVDPRPAAEAWRKITRAGGAAPPAFLALHPTWPGRVEEIDAQIAAVMPIYETALTEQAIRPRQPAVGTRPGLK